MRSLSCVWKVKHKSRISARGFGGNLFGGVWGFWVEEVGDAMEGGDVVGLIWVGSDEGLHLGAEPLVVRVVGGDDFEGAGGVGIFDEEAEIDEIIDVFGDGGDGAITE